MKKKIMKNNCLGIAKRLYSSQANIETKICVVGSGPAGFYAASHLAKNIPSVKIDIYEKLPVPFGLVRYGVAPDHPEVRNVINTFNKTAQNKNVQFVGNIGLGRDVTLKELKEAYHAVLLTYGAEENKRFNIDGENLSNIIAARDIVGWYNGLPKNANLSIDLSGETAAIFGQGNVAFDVARMLLMPIDQLKSTDITQYALEALAASKLKEVYLIGRRGPLQAAVTIKELREILKLQDCVTSWKSSDFEGVKDFVPKLPRPRKRITELMLKSVEEGKSSGSRYFKPVFLRSPLEFVGDKKVQKVKLCKNRLEGTDLPTLKAVHTSETEYLQCDLCIPSIGYKSIQADPDIPFDFKQGVAKNQNGKVSDGVYATGWLATGPRGVILTTMTNAFCIADLMIADLKQQNLTSKPGFLNIRELLQKKNVQIVYWENWLKIDAYEEEEGKKLGKSREKIVSIKKMLEVCV